MSERTRTFTAIGVMLASLAVITLVLAAAPTEPADRVHEIAARLKCPICESESVADSPSQVARDLYALIGEQVDDGWSDDEIFDFFVATYGPQALLDPPASAVTVYLWIAPLLALAVGTVVLIGRRARAPRTISDEERKQVEAALRETER